MIDNRPGFSPSRLLRLINEAIQRCSLNLDGAIVLTEAASGAYMVTPAMAAIAGAERVFAVARATRYGTVAQILKETRQLSDLAGVSDRINFTKKKTKEIVTQADIITNSGHIRPINSEMISWMKSTAVIPLMYETWELRSEDIDLEACNRHGIPVAGTHESHPAIDVFSFLGVMAIKLLLDAGIAVYGSRVLLLCDNPFCSYIEHGLVNVGASVDVATALPAASDLRLYDVILVAMQPRSEPVISAVEMIEVASCRLGPIVAQFWGDIDRPESLTEKMSFWPINPPAPAHMGILPSDIGPEPVIRLQSGGLKVGELLWRARLASESIEATLTMVENSGFGERVTVTTKEQ